MASNLSFFLIFFLALLPLAFNFVLKKTYESSTEWCADVGAPPAIFQGDTKTLNFMNAAGLPLLAAAAAFENTEQQGLAVRLENGESVKMQIGDEWKEVFEVSKEEGSGEYLYTGTTAATYADIFFWAKPEDWPYQWRTSKLNYKWRIPDVILRYFPKKYYRENVEKNGAKV